MEKPVSNGKKVISKKHESLLQGRVRLLLVLASKMLHIGSIVTSVVQKKNMCDVLETCAIFYQMVINHCDGFLQEILEVVCDIERGEMEVLQTRNAAGSMV